MKLLYCENCGDVFSLGLEVRQCSCGEAGGWYHEDGWHAEIWGGIPIGFKNSAWLWALDNRPEFAPGRVFDAFVIEKDCPTIAIVEKPK